MVVGLHGQKFKSCIRIQELDSDVGQDLVVSSIDIEVDAIIGVEELSSNTGQINASTLGCIGLICFKVDCWEFILAVNVGFICGDSHSGDDFSRLQGELIRIEGLETKIIVLVIDLPCAVMEFPTHAEVIVFVEGDLSDFWVWNGILVWVDVQICIDVTVLIIGNQGW